jgi:hypothetical protein
MGLVFHSSGAGPRMPFSGECLVTAFGQRVSLLGGPGHCKTLLTRSAPTSYGRSAARGSRLIEVGQTRRVRDPYRPT